MKVARFAQDKIKPLVQKMDENEKIDPEVIRGLFEQGVCIQMFIVWLYSNVDC